MLLTIDDIICTCCRINERLVLCIEENEAKSTFRVIYKKHGTIFTTVVALKGKIFSYIRKSIVCWATSSLLPRCYFFKTWFLYACLDA